MSGFSPSTFTATIADIESGCAKIPGYLDQGHRVLQSTLANPLVFGWVADALLWAWDRICELATSFLDTVGEILQGAAAPVLFYVRAYDWIQDVKAPMVDLAADVAPDALISSYYWEGEGASAYKQAVADQPGAAKATADIGNTMAIQLAVCATAGLAFYVAIGVIVVKFIAAMVVVVAAFGSVAFSWAGLALAVEEAAVTPAMIVTAVSLLVAALGASTSAMLNMQSAYAGFPGSQWPDTRS